MLEEWLAERITRLSVFWYDVSILEAANVDPDPSLDS